MRFINRYTLLFIAILLVTVTGFYLLLNYLLLTEQHGYIAVLTISYMLVIFFSALIIGKRDIYEGYYGFNYHFLTYVICNATPILFVRLGLINSDFEVSTYRVMITWGIGVFIHFVIYMMLRKRSLRGFDKTELFD